MLSEAGVQRSGTPAQSKHPYDNIHWQVWIRRGCNDNANKSFTITLVPERGQAICRT